MNGGFIYQLKLYLDHQKKLMKIHISVYGVLTKTIMISEETDETIKELFKSLHTSYQEALENKILSLIMLTD